MKHKSITKWKKLSKIVSPSPNNVKRVIGAR
jgi:hypothetical protein